MLQSVEGLQRATGGVVILVAGFIGAVNRLNVGWISILVRLLDKNSLIRSLSGR